MEQRVSLVTLAVSDLARSRRFYEDGLGWRPSGDAHAEVSFYEAGGIVLALFTGLGDELPQAAGASSPGRIALAHNVRSPEEVDAVVAEVVRAGGTVLVAPQTRDWGGYTGYVADPDGHPWEIAYNPGWPLADDGSVVIPAR